MINRFTLGVWGLPKEDAQTMKMAQEYITKLLPGNGVVSATSCGTSVANGVLYTAGNLLENTKFGPLYPNASECFVVAIVII